MARTSPEQDKALVFEAFHTLFDKRGVAVDTVRLGEGKLAKQWHVPRQEATKAHSKGGLPTFCDWTTK